MAKLMLVEGPVGAGKTTFARTLAEQRDATFLCLDDWFARLFIPDRPPGADIGWYLERKARCTDLIRETATSILNGGARSCLSWDCWRASAGDHSARR